MRGSYCLGVIVCYRRKTTKADAALSCHVTLVLRMRNGKEKVNLCSGNEIVICHKPPTGAY